MMPVRWPDNVQLEGGDLALATSDTATGMAAGGRPVRWRPRHLSNRLIEIPNIQCRHATPAC